MLKLLVPSSTLLLLSIMKFKFIWEKCTIFFSWTFLFLFFVFYSSESNIIFSSEMFFIDPMSISLILLSMWVFILMVLASWNINISNNRKKEFYFWASALTMILVLSFSLNNALFFYFSFEASLIPIMVIILGWGYQPERLQASSYMILYTVCASLPLLMILLKLFNETFSLSFFYLMINNQINSNFSGFMWLLIILAFLTKLPMFLLHLWLPKAHVEAPVAGSMILAGVLLKLGSYGLIRMASIFLLKNVNFFSMISSLCLWGALVTSLICLRQVDMKALVAYSSVGHMGLLLGGTLSSNLWGWQSSLLMMLAHGVCSSGMFMMANSIYEKTHNRSLFLTKGILNIFPNLVFWWFLFNIINMAAPPSLNLASELMLVTSIISCSNFTIFILGFISFLAAAYSLFLFTVTAHGKISSYLMFSSNFKSREYLNMMIHWMPLNFLVLKLDMLTLWF